MSVKGGDGWRMAIKGMVFKSGNWERIRKGKERKGQRIKVTEGERRR